MAGRSRALRLGRVAVCVVSVTAAVGLVGVPAAYANVGFSVPTPTGLTDGQSVPIVLSGLNVVPFASVEISECGNAYADNSALPSLNASSDCQVLRIINVSNISGTILNTSVQVAQTGLGLGNRSCITSGVIACVLRISNMVNQIGSPIPSSVNISFAADPPSGTPFPTVTTAAEVGAPAALGKTAYAHVVVGLASPPTSGTFVPEGTVTVTLDGTPLPSAPLVNGATTIPLGTPALGQHTLQATFDGNGSFATSSSPASWFEVIRDRNISVGDVSVVEGDTGSRTIAVPVVLSQPPIVNPIWVHYTVIGGTATPNVDFTPVSGSLRFGDLATINYVLVKVWGNTIPDGDRSFYVVLTIGPSSYDFRRQASKVTILDDDATSGLRVGMGDATIPEGDIGGTKTVKIPLSLSRPQATQLTVTVTLSSVNAIHKVPFHKNDWGGLIVQQITFLIGATRAFVSIPIYSDTIDEPDLSVTAAITAVPAGVGISRAVGTMTILSDE